MIGRHQFDTIDRDLPPVTAHPDIACRGADTALFFPERGNGAGRAKAICGRCPHRVECLEWALDTRQAYGVLGGLSPEERASILHERSEAP